jgi:Holliday junction resolvasome RuvABC DNA-binding subunit
MERRMTILSAIRDRFSSLPSTESQREASAAEADNGALPFAGYDRLDARQVTKELSDHSQIELEAAEAYERSHKGREVVLNKLRYMRGSEPFPAYDALSVEEILTALEEADLETIDRVRGYERKFANRPRVLETVARVHRSRLAIEPARDAPAYQPMSARSAPSRRGAQRRSGP